MKILLPVDGSLYTKKMLAYLATHTDMFAKSNEPRHAQPAGFGQLLQRGSSQGT